jgi:hypothetical protein
MNFRFTKKQKLKLSKIYFVDSEGNLIEKEHFVLKIWLMGRASWELLAFTLLFAAHLFLMGLVLYSTILWVKSTNTATNWILFGLIVAVQVVTLGFTLVGMGAVLQAFHKKYLAPRVQKLIDRFEDNFNPPDKSQSR